MNVPCLCGAYDCKRCYPYLSSACDECGKKLHSCLCEVCEGCKNLVENCNCPKEDE